MLKWAAEVQGETYPCSEGPGNKRLRRSSPEEEAQKSSTVIVVDSPEQAPDSMLALEGAA